MSRSGRRWALVANASPGGIGESLAIAFRKRGVNVVATTAKAGAMEYLEPEKGSDDGFLVTLQLDSTSSDSILAAVQQVHQLTDGRLDFLVNTTDSAYYVPLIDADIEQAKKQYDVGVWGLLAVTKAFFPLLRASKGIIVNQVKDSGLQGFNTPFTGVDSSAQAAILSLSSILRVELQPFCIRVVTLVSGDIQTGGTNDFSGDGISGSSAYYQIKEEVDRIMSSYSASKGRDAYQVADETVGRLLGESPPPAYIRYGFMVKLLPLIYWLFPTWVLDFFVAKNGALDRLKHLLSDTSKTEKYE